MKCNLIEFHRDQWQTMVEDDANANLKCSIAMALNFNEICDVKRLFQSPTIVNTIHIKDIISYMHVVSLYYIATANAHTPTQTHTRAYITMFRTAGIRLFIRLIWVHTSHACIGLLWTQAHTHTQVSYDMSVHASDVHMPTYYDQYRSANIFYDLVHLSIFFCVIWLDQVDVRTSDRPTERTNFFRTIVLLSEIAIV